MNRRRALKSLALTGAAITLPAWNRVKASLDIEFHDPEKVRKNLDKIAHEPAARAIVRNREGGPRLYINDEQVFPLMATSVGLLQTADEFSRSHIDFFQTIVGMHSFWIGPDEYDWRLFDQFLAELLQINPDAFFLPRLQMNTPTWWKEEHPDELIEYQLEVNPKRYNFSETQKMQPGGHRWGIGMETYEASWASQKWRQDYGKMLQAFIDHIQDGPLKSRVIGYHPTTGYTGEWGYTGPHSLPDISTPMQNASGPIPEADKRRTTTCGLLRDPLKEKKVIDFYQRFHETVADTILYFAAKIREKTNGRVLTGVYYAYLMENIHIQEIGYLAPKRVLESREIDFIASPYSYLHTNVPDRPRHESDVFDGAGNWLGRARGVAGDGGIRVMQESLRRYNKLPLLEMDASTYLEPGSSGIGGSGKETLEGTLKILKRDLGQMYVKGIAGWLYDFGPLQNQPGWYTSKPIIKLVQEFVRLGRKRLNMDIHPVAETLTLADPQSFFVSEHWMQSAPYKNMGSYYFDFINHWFHSAQLRSFSRMGTPMDFLYSFDLRQEDLKTYKLIFATNLFYLNDRDVKRIRGWLSNSGAMVVWYYAPGFVSPQMLNLEQMQYLTGFRYEILQEPGPMMIRTEMDDTGIPRKFGVNTEKYPRFAVKDDADVLGRWVDNDRAAFTVKEMDGWRSVYLGTAPLPVEILRWLSQEAGVALWSDQPDIVYATRDAAMIVATFDGKRTLSLPKTMAFAQGGAAQKKHELEMEFGQVELFLSA
jgi:hypothetical protein